MKKNNSKKSKTVEPTMEVTMMDLCSQLGIAVDMKDVKPLISKFKKVNLSDAEKKMMASIALKLTLRMAEMIMTSVKQTMEIVSLRTQLAAMQKKDSPKPKKAKA